MKLTKEQLMDKLKEYVGDKTDDATIELLEAVTDSIPESDGEDWKAKYDQLDADWRKRYTERFYSTPEGEDKPPEGGNNDEPEDNGEDVTIDDLFKEV